MPDEARATLTGFSAERERMSGIHNARAVICLAEGDPATALDVLRDVQDTTPPVDFPAFALVEAHLLAGIAHLRPGGSKRCRCRSRGGARGRRARPADLPVCNDRRRGAARRAPASRNGSWRPSRRHRRPAARCAGAERRPRAPHRNRRSSARASSAYCAICRQTSRGPRSRESSTSRSTRSTRTSATSTPSSVCVIAPSAVQRARELRLLSTGRSRTSPR